VTEYKSCGYTHDISNEDRNVDIFGQIDAEEWSCQHPVDDSEYCLFHQPAEEKDDQAVVERFQKIINIGYDDVDLAPQERFRFLGAEFGDFSLPLVTTLATSDQLDPAAAEYPLDLRDIRVEGALHWSKTTVRHGLLFDGAFVGGEVDFFETTIEGDCSFTGGQFASLVQLDEVDVAGALSLDHAEFELAVSMASAVVGGEVSLENSHAHAPEEGDERLESVTVDPGDIYGPDSQVEASLTMTDAEIEGSICFPQSEVRENAQFENADIGGSAEFENADIERGAQFENADIEREAQFENADVGWAQFENTDIGREAQFEDADIENWAQFENVDIGREAQFMNADIGLWALFNDADIKKDAQFEDADIGGAAVFENADIGRSAQFEDADIAGWARFENADIGRSAEFDNADIGESAKFKNADIGRSAEFEDADIGREAQFENADIGESAKFKNADIRKAKFENADIGWSAEFENADIEYNAEFENADIRKAQFENADIGGWAKFENADIKRYAQFRNADIGREAQFENADIVKGVNFAGAAIGEAVKFENATTEKVSLENATFPGDATCSGNFGEGPSLTGLHVAGTLNLDLTDDTDGPVVVHMTNATVRSLAVTDDARSQVLNLTDATVGRFDDQDISDANILYRWSLSEMDFSQFDFTESRDMLSSIDWELHSLEKEAREALARDAARDRAADQVDVLFDLLVGVPALSRRLVNGDLSVQDSESLVTAAAEIVFTDETIVSQIVDAIVSQIVDADLNDTDVTEDPAVRAGVLDDEWTYTKYAARAIHDLREAVEHEPEFVDALADDAVASQVEAIAATVVEADPNVGPEVEDTPKEQIDTGALPTEELQAALVDVYADPEEFRAENNPEMWETTYLDAKNAATDQGLSDMAAEFFSWEKHFRRKRHAQRDREE